MYRVNLATGMSYMSYLVRGGKKLYQRKLPDIRVSILLRLRIFCKCNDAPIKRMQFLSYQILHIPYTHVQHCISPLCAE